MNDTQRRRYERGSRVDVYMTANAADFPSGSKGAATAARLKTELTGLSALDVAKATTSSTRQQTSAGRSELRKTLRELLAAVCDTAEAIGHDHSEVRGRFPRARADKSDQTLVAVARSFAEAATPLKALFIEFAMSPDFIERLNDTADALEAQITRQTETRGASVNTNASIEESLGRADDFVELIGVVVRNKYRHDSARLAAWERASRLERAPHSKHSGDEPPQTPTQG